MMNSQEKQVALDLAYSDMRQEAYDKWSKLGLLGELGVHGGIITSLTRWTNAVTEPDCSYYWNKREDPEGAKSLCNSYFMTLACDAAVEL